ncbi:MAG TPA: RimK family protein [Noviherbaspirillum sp.]|jgi:glutathione synthase/RimK-type ligase-like ATP-grasp enzyme|uniref:RimK family protein n=1 Tax=Noviherbaspirillum sp. TaxID=1926288 RepID=UPI002F9292B4
MNVFFVVSEPGDWPGEMTGVTIVSDRTYLLDPAFGDTAAARVVNLCRSYGYQTAGYYVSLLAEARGHRPVPGVGVLKDLHSPTLLQEIGDKLGTLADCSFALTQEDTVDLDIYFGRDAGQQHPHMADTLFKLLQTPVLRARFERGAGHWMLCRLAPGGAAEIPDRHRAFALQAAADYLREQKIRGGPVSARKPTVAILHAPDDRERPSNPAAMDKFREAAELIGMETALVTRRDAHRLADYDALFIRATTNVDHYTYQLSRQAAEAGMVVIDDPDSILRCTNKIYLNELLARHHVPTPRTLVVHRGNIDQIVPLLGLPCILKQPDGAFSRGVVKVENEQDLPAKVTDMLRSSELVLAQEFLPTEYDWRVGVLDRRPLFVCKYYMAPGHWQIIRHDQHQVSEGRTEALSIGEAPDEVVSIAVQAANLIGDGFYGVDLKQVGAQVHVIEINDNPNVDAGNEDAVLSDALYREVMGVFRKRIESGRGSSA